VPPQQVSEGGDKFNAIAVRQGDPCRVVGKSLLRWRSPGDELGDHASRKAVGVFALAPGQIGPPRQRKVGRATSSGKRAKKAETVLRLMGDRRVKHIGTPCGPHSVDARLGGVIAGNRAS